MPVFLRLDKPPAKPSGSTPALVVPSPLTSPAAIKRQADALHLGTSLQRHLQAGQVAVQFVRDLRLRSNTYAQARLNQMVADLEADPQSHTAQEIAQLKQRITLLGLEGLQFRAGLKQRDITSLDAFVENLCRASRQSRFGNCGEQAVLAARQLHDAHGFRRLAIVGVDMVSPAQQAGYRPKAFNPDIASHTFVVLGLNRDADLARPDTWGESAVMVDPWIGFALPVTEGLARMTRFFRADDHRLVFSNWVDDLDLDFRDKGSDYDWLNVQRRLNNPSLLSGDEPSKEGRRLLIIG